MDVATDEMNPIVKKVLESKEFKKAVQAVIEDSCISASNIDGLQDEVESVINNGSFDASIDISFSP